MLATYYKNLEQTAALCKKLEPAAQKVGAIDIANYMADLVGQMFKAAWFVKATLRSM
jgi:DNA-binding ferritin-like protein